MPTSAPTCWVYIIECGDGSYYTGATRDLIRRLIQHIEGKGSKYTQSHLPVKLVYAEPQPDWSSALKREWHIKHLTRLEKEQLIMGLSSNKVDDVYS